MDDGLLLHAKRLSAAANAVAEGLTSSLEGLNRQKEATKSDKSLPKSPPKQFEVPLRISVESGAGEILRTSKSEFSPTKIFRGAAFNGSSLLTTYTDLRPFLLKGQLFSVDGISCRFKEDGEYSSSRLEMQEDFTGPASYSHEFVII